MSGSSASDRSGIAHPPGRASQRGRRRTLLIVTLAAFVVVGFVVSSWLRGGGLPGVSLAAVELNVGLLKSEETHFLGRDVWEHTFGVREDAPAYSLYVDERGRTIGFAAMLEFDADRRAVAPDSLRPALEFLKRYVGDVGLAEFAPAPARDANTPANAVSRETRRVIRGMNVWLLEYGEYEASGAASPARLVRSRSYVVVTNPGWPIPEGVNAR